MAYSLFETAELGPLISKNRTVRSATNEHLSDPSGQITPAWVDSLEALARGGVGIIITGHLSVDRDQRADEGQAVLDQETDPALLSLAAQRVHQHGALLIAQISHSGGKARPGVNGRPPLSPGDLTPQLLDRLVEQFRHAARTAQMAGFDGVQVHCAHNYLLSSFLNLRWNHREDAYGGSLENRFRLIRRVLLAVRDACGPRFALLVKVDNDSCDDLPALLRLFQSAGVDGIELSGLDMARRDGQKTPFFLDRLLAAWEGLTVPIFPVGGVFSRAAAEKVLAAGAPFVSLSRALICQPTSWSGWKKARQRAPAWPATTATMCTASARCAVCSIPKSSPSWRRCSAPTPPDFPRARSPDRERARSHFCPPVPALKKENRKK